MVLTHLDHIYLLFNNISRATFKVNMDIMRGDARYDHHLQLKLKCVIHSHKNLTKKMNTQFFDMVEKLMNQFG
jgi:hypothetical protein